MYYLTLCDFVFTPLQNRAPFGIGSILGGKNLFGIQALHFMNWSLFWKGVGKSVTEAASPIVCPFAFTTRYYNVQLYKVQVYYSYSHTKK